MTYTFNFKPRNPTARCVIAALLCWGGNQALAAAIPTANSDVAIRFDNTVRYNLGVRTQRQDPLIMRNPGFDESDGKFKRGDIVTNRLDLLTELDVGYERDLLGMRVSGATWYDHAYNDDTVRTNPANGGFASSYNNNRYSSKVSRFYNGPSGEILDAFVYGRIDLGDMPLRIKLGKHALYWGESIFFGAHSISYSQSPTDGMKGAAIPGLEVKESFLPVNQISFSIPVTNSVVVAGQYFLDWKPNRLPQGGTYFGPSDILYDGPDRRPVNASGVTSPRLDSLEPRSRGNYGVNVKWNAEEADALVGAYYRRFDDRQPWTQILATGYRLAYAEDLQLYGLSVGKVIGGVSVGAEVSYRKNASLNAANVSGLDNAGPRGNTVHATLGGTLPISKNALFDTGTLTAELAYSSLRKVTSHAELFRGEGYAGCAAGQGKWQGCATKSVVVVAANFIPQWLAVFPSVDITAPMTFNYGVKGNGATLGGGNQGALTYSAAVVATIQAVHEVTLRYAGSSAHTFDNGTSLLGGNGNIGATDRGWVSLTYKTSF